MFTSRTFRDYLYKQLDLEDPYLVYLCVQLLLCKKAPLIKNWFEESRRLHFHSEKEFFQQLCWRRPRNNWKE